MTRKMMVMLVVASFFCLGMGGGVDVVSSIPKPDRVFNVRVVDATDTSYNAGQVSVDGVTFLPVRLGGAELGVDFAKISRVRFYLQGETVAVAVTGRDGQDMPSMTMDPNILFSGSTDWGNFRLKAKDIREISFQ
ncbi:MAG: hypothetical protein EOM25_11015 [Deltaproteobacteria bacterium]|nr:hypothetical protein [Deltaproteobacteria bacterium]